MVFLSSEINKKIEIINRKIEIKVERKIPMEMEQKHMLAKAKILI